MIANRYKHLILASIAVVATLIICPFFRINAVLAQTPGEIEPECGVLSVDYLNTNELEPLDPARFNRGSVTHQGRTLDGLDQLVRPDWEEAMPRCPRWEELEVLSSN